MDHEDVVGAEVLALWRRCAEASRERDWEALVRRLDARLRRLVRSCLWRLGGDPPCREDIEELAQEVYCRLLGNGRRAFRECRAGSPGELWSYLERICASVAVDRHRSRNARKRRGGVRGDSPRPAEAATALDDPEWCPEERLWRARARARILETCLAHASCPNLASRNRYIVESVVFEGLSIGEVASRVGMGKSGVNSVLARLRRRIEAGLAGARVHPRTPARAPAGAVAVGHSVA
jgi:RNA polymerase sigma factor (sigma-70 family)